MLAIDVINIILEVCKEDLTGVLSLAVCLRSSSQSLFAFSRCWFLVCVENPAAVADVEN